MGRYFVFLVITAAFLARANGLSSATYSTNLVTSQRASPSNRFLRYVGTTNEDNNEERVIAGEKLLLKFSKWAEKREMYTLSKKLEHNAWLKAGETLQTLFRKYNWKGKTTAELKNDPNYLRYEGFDDLWLLAQYKKGTILKPDKWIKLTEGQGKKKTPPSTL